MRPAGEPKKSPWGTPTPSKHPFGRRLLIIAAVAAVLLAALLTAFPPSVVQNGQGVYIVRSLVLLAVIIVVLAASRRSLLAVAGQISIWLMLFLGVVAAYAYRTELKEVAGRTAAALMPTRGRAESEHVITYARAADGHFWIDATVNGTAVRFLLDTGASGIVLGRADAARLGFDAQRLSFNQMFETANGRTRGAPVNLDDLRIGPFVYRQVGASVNEGEMRQSLLGMRFLDRLSSVEIRGDSLTIRQ
jgi:aspartyl protease family protein